MVTVDSTVRLEVLDWGGRGRPLVFVGCYLSAHVFDEIAPKLRDQFRVYAVTRRGVGASDTPTVGYDPQRRADDILEVMSALGLRKPILVGNACGGHVLHTLGGQHPERVGALVYLDAAEDPTITLSEYAFPPADRVNLAAFRGKPVQVLALYRTTTLQQTLKDFPPRTEREREAIELAVAARRPVLDRWQSDLRAGVPAARIVEVPHANLFMFLSHEADVIREIRAFAATLRH